NTVVLSIADVETSARVESQRVRAVEFAAGPASLAPGLQELARLVELDDTRVVRCLATVAVGDEDVTVFRDSHIRRLVERHVVADAVAFDAGLPERHQHLSVLIELEHLLSLAAADAVVGHPDESFRVDADLVRADEQPGAEALEELSGRIELQNRIER